MKKKTVYSSIPLICLRLFFLFFALAPLVWLALTSIKPIKEIITMPVIYIPSYVTFENYVKAIRETSFPVYFKNSLIVSLSAAFVTTVLSILNGYSLTRFRFRGRNLSLVIFLATQMVPIAVIIVPIFLVFSALGLINSLGGLILIYSVLNIPFCTLVIRGFFQHIPVSLEEAALIDGCGRFKSIVRIVLPLMSSGIIATSVFAFIGAWNELFFNSLFISTEANKTIPAGINMFIGKYNIDWGMISATGVLALIPVCVMFAIIQRYLVSGLTSGAVKG